MKTGTNEKVATTVRKSFLTTRKRLVMKMPVEDILKKLGKDDFLEKYYQERNQAYTSAKRREKSASKERYLISSLSNSTRLENKNKKEKKREEKIERKQISNGKQKNREDAPERFREQPNQSVFNRGFSDRVDSKFRNQAHYLKQNGRNSFTPNHQNPGSKYHANSVDNNGSWNKIREEMPKWKDKNKETLGSIGNRDDRSQHSSASKKVNKYPDSDHEFYE